MILLLAFLLFKARHHQWCLSSLMEHHSLTIEEFREYLGDTVLTDAQILELRDSLCVLIDKTVDAYFDKKLQ